MGVTLNKNQAGLTLGLLSGVTHFLWVILAAFGLGQGFANFVHSMHFLSDMHTVMGISWGFGILGIVIAFVSGYVMGFVFAALWNWIGEKI